MSGDEKNNLETNREDQRDEAGKAIRKVEPRKEIKPEDIRNVTVPLAVDQIKEFFVNKDLLYFVDYANSDLKGVVFLTYLANLDLPAEINFEGSTYEQKAELFKIYMETRNQISCESLRYNIARLVLQYRGIDATRFYHNLALDRAESERFLSENMALFEKWEIFLESTVVYAIHTVKAFEGRIDLKGDLEVIEDPQFIGANVVHLFSIPGFMEFFFTIPYKHKLRYFRPQFEDYMFRGNNLYYYYANEENLMYLAFVAHVHGAISLEEIHQIGVLSGQIIEAQNG